ncbi:MAG: hypothetical protein PHN57_02215 [Candidatus Omnitrophica bacterium]|nr:hypothetical protein [Candidatus Omnitrophota bacterium]
MPEEISIFEAIQRYICWSVPVLFVFGLVLVFYGNYQKLEKLLGRELSPIKKIRIAVLEDENFTFHEWLLKRKIFLGFICIGLSAVFYFVLKS